MKWNISVPDSVRATVRDGILTLDGTVDWNFERRAAATAVENIAGVHNVINSIELNHIASLKTYTSALPRRCAVRPMSTPRTCT